MAEGRALRIGRRLAACLLVVSSGCGGGDEDNASTPLDGGVFDVAQSVDTGSSADRSEQDELQGSNQGGHDGGGGHVDDATDVVGDIAPESAALDAGGPPTSAPMAIAFTDTYPGCNRLEGVVTISKAADESDITGYALYYGSSTTTKLYLQPIATIQATGHDVTYEFLSW